MKRKFSFKKTLFSIILVICLIVFLISLFRIINYTKASKETHEQIKKIDKETKVEEVKDNENTEIIESDVDKDNPYWDFIKMSLINVDFTDLKNTNSDTVGWIQVNGTNINYPIVKTDNNDYYLNHSFYKTVNESGWVFMDYRNNASNFDRNTIIYAHGRWDKTMFGTLKNSLTNGWLNNSNNYVVKLSTENENTLWQVFSVYRIPTTNDYLATIFDNDDIFLNFANMLKDRSQFKFNTPVNSTDKILTLSTCYNENEKVVLHAKLIKREAR